MFPSAPIFQQYNYFRQNLEENVTFTFFLVLPQLSRVKYYETIKILMEIFYCDVLVSLVGENKNSKILSFYQRWRFKIC